MRALVLLLAALPGCVIQRNTTTETDELAFDEPVELVEIDVGAGDLTVRVGSGGLEISRVWEYSGSRPDADAWVQDGVLYLDVDCGAMQLTCRVDHVVTLPAGAAIVGELGSGDVDIQGIVGDIDLGSGSGDMNLRSVTGTILVTTGSGNIDVSDAVGTLDLETGSGDISAALAEMGSAFASTGSGDVLLQVPAGAYRIRTETGSGDVRMEGLTSDPGAAATLDVHTGSGDVDLIGR